MSVRDKRSRPAKNPGGMECQRCHHLFIGEEWHEFCAICVQRVADDIATAQGLKAPVGPSGERGE